MDDNRLTVTLRTDVACPECRTAPTFAQFRMLMATPDQLVTCPTCGKARPKQTWLQLDPEPKLNLDWV